MRRGRLNAGRLGSAMFFATTLAWGQSPVPTAGPGHADPRSEGGPRVEPRLQSDTTHAARVTLQDAVAQALAKNPTYVTALLEIHRAEAVVRETKAAWLPTLYGNGGFSHLDGNRVSQGIVVESQN